MVGKAARSFAEVNEALMRTRQEYYDALAGHRGDPDDTEAIHKANTRLDAASVAYAKALPGPSPSTPFARAGWTSPQASSGTIVILKFKWHSDFTRSVK